MSTDPLLRKLVDKDEISDLLTSFGAALDARDWTAYGETFVADGTFTIMGQARHGREEIVDGPRRDLERYGILQHFSANHRIVVDGDRATATHYVIAVHGPDAGEPKQHADIGGRYTCQCVRTDAGWKFDDVVLDVLWAAGETFAIEEK